MKKKGDECKGFVTKRSTGLLFVCILSQRMAYQSNSTTAESLHEEKGR